MFITKNKISFHDCDPAGILFFSKVYEICHSAYEDLIRTFNLKEDYWNNMHYVVPILKSEAHYHKPLKHGEEISIQILVKTLKSSSFELQYEILNAKKEVCVVAYTVHVFVDKITWGKKAMNNDIIDCFKKYRENKS